MIWKEEDVINLAKGKNAIQSSISKWSHIDDANRAIDANIADCDFAFHTGYEDRPYWMVDLEEIKPIDCIRITNRKNLKYQKVNQNLSVECSLDGIVWTKIDPNMYEWTNLDVLEINILQSLSARYVKISLNIQGHLVLRKIEILARKYKGYIIGSRPDGLGMRIGAIINAIYLSKKLDFKFVFTWANYTDTDQIGANGGENKKQGVSYAGEILRAEDAFDIEFLNKHCISEKYYSYGSDVSTLSLKDDHKKFMKRKWGAYVNQAPLDCLMIGLSTQEYLSETKNSYKEIKWSDRCAKIIKDIDYICNEIISGSFIAIHIRGGEVVIGEFKIAPEVWMRSRHFPYEIAIELAKMEWDKNNIIIIGQDFVANQILENYLNKIKPHKDIKIYSIDSLIKNRYNYTNPERSFFDINFLSRSSKIYATGSSSFSNVANMIAGKELVCSFYDIYSLEEIYNIIRANINCIDIGNLHRAYCYYRLCSMARRLKKPIDTSRQWLVKAINEDPDNGFYKVIMADLWFEEKELKKVDEYLQSCVFEESFFEAVYGSHTLFGWATDYYNHIRDQYIQFASMEYPYISYVAAKICIFRKNPDEALRFITYSLKLQPNNDLFISMYHKIANLIPGQSPTLPKPEIIQPQEQTNNNAQELQTSQDITDSLRTQIADKDLENQKLQKINADLYFTLNYGTAKSRIKNQLSYKLGQAMIANSKSIWGYIKMPYILSYIKETHQKNQKLYQEKIKANPSLKLPPLEIYPDYNEAIKLKNHLSYKLGEALINADKSKLKLGYLTLWFKCKKIQMECKKNK